MPKTVLRPSINLLSHEVRRLLSGKPAMVIRAFSGSKRGATPHPEAVVTMEGGRAMWEEDNRFRTPRERVCPFGTPGDLRDVRESWYSPAPGQYLYRASDEPLDTPEFRWKAPHGIPQEAVRLGIRVVSVEARKLHTLTPQELTATGWDEGDDVSALWTRIVNPYRYAEKLGQRYADNPWAWFITVEKPR